MFIFLERGIPGWGNQFFLGLEPFLDKPFTRYLLVLPLENHKNNNHYFLGESDRGTRRLIPFWVRLSRYWRVSMGWLLLQLMVKIVAKLPLTVNFRYD